MSKRYEFHLTQYQVYAICEALNEASQRRDALTREPYMQKLQFRDSKAMLHARSDANANLVVALIDGLKPGTSWPTDRHDIFTPHKQTDAA